MQEKNMEQLLGEIKSLQLRIAELEKLNSQYKKIEDHIRDDELRYRELFNHMGNGVAVYGAIDNGNDFVFLDMNKAGGKITSASINEIKGKRVTECFPSVRNIGLLDVMKQVWKTGEPQGLPLKLYKDEKISMWVDNYVYKLPSGEIVAIYDDITESKKATEELFDSKEYLNKIINCIADPVFVKDRQHRMVLVNDAECSLTGHAREEVIGKTDYDFFPKEQVDVFWQQDELVFETGKESVNEEYITDANGRIKTIVTKKTLYMDNKGEKFIVRVIRDITEIRKAGEALQESEKRYKALFKESADAMFIADPETRMLVDCNKKAEELIGRSKDEIMSMRADDLHPQDAVKDVMDIFARQAKGEKIIAESFILTKKGARVPIAISTAIVEINGRPYLVGIFRDISKRRKSEDALLASLNLLYSVVENAPIRVFWKDLELRYLGCNTAFARDAGMSCPKDLIGKDDFQMGWRKQAELYRADDKKVMDSGVPKLGFEEPQTTPDGGTIWLRTSKVPLYDANAKVMGVLGIYDDITELKIAEDGLKEKIHDLEIFHRASVDREMKILELKDRIKVLEAKLNG